MKQKAVPLFATLSVLAAGCAENITHQQAPASQISQLQQPRVEGEPELPDYEKYLEINAANETLLEMMEILADFQSQAEKVLGDPNVVAKVQKRDLKTGKEEYEQRYHNPEATWLAAGVVPPDSPASYIPERAIVCYKEEYSGVGSGEQASCSIVEVDEGGGKIGPGIAFFGGKEPMPLGIIPVIDKDGFSRYGEHLAARVFAVKKDGELAYVSAVNPADGTATLARLIMGKPDASFLLTSDLFGKTPELARLLIKRAVEETIKRIEGELPKEQIVPAKPPFIKKRK